jgi:hypothetical protein
MKLDSLLVSFVFSSLLAVEALAQVPALPVGFQTKWVVDEPEEIVGYLIFDPATVKERISSFLRFITIEELAADQILWAKEHLSEYPAHADWGISFIEIVRMKTFEIDGRTPEWPEHGAAALWFARVAPSSQIGPYNSAYGRQLMPTFSGQDLAPERRESDEAESQEPDYWLEFPRRSARQAPALLRPV